MLILLLVNNRFCQILKSYLVCFAVCDHALGLISGTVKDEHITASDSRGKDLKAYLFM